MVVDRPQSSFAEAFRRLRTSIHFARPDQQSTIIAVPSSLPGEGKTTTAICLARSAALAGARVILVACDLRRSASSMKFNPNMSIGIAKRLDGKVTLTDAIFQHAAKGMYVLTPSTNQKHTESTNKLR